MLPAIPALFACPTTVRPTALRLADSCPWRLGNAAASGGFLFADRFQAVRAWQRHDELEANF